MEVAAFPHPPSGRMNTYASPLAPRAEKSDTTTFFPFPLIATISPKRADVSAVRCAVAATGDVPHPPSGLVNTYAEPCLLMLGLADTTTVLPFVLIDTEPPKLSCPSVTGGASLAASFVFEFLHPAAGFVNTYAAPTLYLMLPPVPSSSPLAPAMIVFPSALTATDTPNRSYRAGSARMICAEPVAPDHSDHPPAGLVNTHTEPAANLRLYRSCCAPTTTVLPSALTATEFPNLSLTVVSRPAILTAVCPVLPSHPPDDGLVNMYTAPALFPSWLSSGAPTTIVLPSLLAATDDPNASLRVMTGDARRTPLGALGPTWFSHRTEPPPPSETDDAPKTPASPPNSAAVPRIPSAKTVPNRVSMSSPFCCRPY